jgi:hypothetical protein
VDQELALGELGIVGAVDGSIKERLNRKLTVAESLSSSETGIILGFILRSRGGRGEGEESKEEKGHKELHYDFLRS